MKYIIISFLIFIPIFLNAAIEPDLVEKISIEPTTTLQDVADQVKIPVKKMIECLDLSLRTNSQQKIKDLAIGKTEIKNAILKYNKIRYHFYWSIVLLGMIIVFASLLLTGFIINLLQHLNQSEKKKSTKRLVNTPYGKISSSSQLSNNEIVAAITTIFLHEMEVEEQNKMILTWKRAPLSLWKVSRILPNQEFFKSKR